MSVSRAFAKEVNQEVNLGLKVDVVEQVCKTFLNLIVKKVKEGKNVTFKNMMSFKRVYRPFRLHKNPKTGDPIPKDAHYIFTMNVNTAMRNEFKVLPIEEGAKVEPVAAGSESAEDTKSE